MFLYYYVILSKIQWTDVQPISKAFQSYMLSKKQFESYKLPPTFSALKYMIYQRQSHYMTYIWDSVFKDGPSKNFSKFVFHTFYLVHSWILYLIYQSSVHTNPTLPDPEDFGWLRNDDGYKPFMNDNARKCWIYLSLCLQPFIFPNVEFNKVEFEQENTVRNWCVWKLLKITRGCWIENGDFVILDFFNCPFY